VHANVPRGTIFAPRLMSPGGSRHSAHGRRARPDLGTLACRSESGMIFMMTQRCFIPVGIFAACVCCLALAALSLLSSTGVTKANFDQIQIGMTKTDVENIFGRPAWDDVEFPRKWPTQLTWMDTRSGYSAEIIFDESGLVVGRGAFYESVSEITTFKGFCRWLLNEPLPLRPGELPDT
jgi:hypothetical protein